MEKDNRLRACPFCGTMPEYYIDSQRDGREKILSIQCPECLAKKESFGKDVTTSVLLEYGFKSWNKRVKPKTCGGINEKA